MKNTKKIVAAATLAIFVSTSLTNVMAIENTEQNLEITPITESIESVLKKDEESSQEQEDVTTVEDSDLEGFVEESIEESIEPKSTSYVGRSIEDGKNLYLDDNELEISLDDYLNQKANGEVQESYAATTYTADKIDDELTIYNTNFNWNGKLELINSPKKIVLHHIEASRPGQTIPVTDIHQWHLSNGWTGIGYHFYITKDGTVYRGRPENAIGAHASGNNVNTLGIAVEGKYDTESMPEAQKAAVIKVGEYLRQKYEIGEVYGHKEVTPTSCPGKNFPLDEIRKRILAYQIKPNPELSSFGVQYQAQGEVYGWQNWTNNGKLAGTTGQEKRMEAIKIQLVSAPSGLNIKYRSHSEGDAGWRSWVQDGQVAGTIGESKRLEAIQIKLEGTNADKYSVEYRAHGEDYGWQPWVKDGATAGTLGQARRIEAIEIRIVEKKDNVVEGNKNISTTYAAQGEVYGWQSWVENGKLAGTTGQSKRMESIKIKLVNAPDGLNIKYRSHSEGDAGWRSWVQNGEISGTVGEYKRLEAIQIKLEGTDADKYSIEYRAHGEDYGWQPWVKDGETAGTMGQARRIEGIEIRIVQK